MPTVQVTRTRHQILTTTVQLAANQCEDLQLALPAQTQQDADTLARGSTMHTSSTSSHTTVVSEMQDLRINTTYQVGSSTEPDQ